MTPEFAVALGVIFIAGFVYEVRQAAAGRKTISEQVWAFARQWPPILFLAGILAGHLFTC